MAVVRTIPHRRFDWDRREAGIDEYERSGNPFPDETLDSIRRNGVGIKGPTTTPVGSGFRSVNVLLRKELSIALINGLSISR